MKIIKTVIWVITVLAILTLASQAQGQANSDLKSIINTVVEKAKSTALNSRYVKWDSIHTVMTQVSANAKSLSDLKECFEILLVSLNDKHGAFYDPATSSVIAQYPGKQNSRFSNQELSLKEEAKFDYRILHHNVRYIRLIAAPAGTDVQKHAEMIRLAIDSLSKEEAPYWIVDLRYAIGGEMNALFAGLGPLLGEGLIATTVDGKKQIRDLYAVYNGKFYDNQVLTASFPSSTKDMRNAKIAVLTSKHTMGAAEILALGFKGRKNTRLIGEETAGQISGVTEIRISDKLVMSISETMYNDRKGSAYVGSLTPDTKVEFIPRTNLEDDAAITEARLWLTTTPVSHTSAKVSMK
jgi:carboxyl-terminal processing protease